MVSAASPFYFTFFLPVLIFKLLTGSYFQHFCLIILARRFLKQVLWFLSSFLSSVIISHIIRWCGGVLDFVNPFLFFYFVC